MKIRIVSDSSADLLTLCDVDFVSVPLSIRTDCCEYTDNADLDVDKMTSELLSYKGRSQTSCPNVSQWEEAFEDADIVYAFPISKNISGSFNSAFVARTNQLEKYPNKKIYIANTLSAGPEITLAVFKMRELILSGTEFDTACREMDEYLSRTGLLFVLCSLHNFVQNGRVSKLAATASGILGIRIVGEASEVGDLKLLTKFRGNSKFVPEMMDSLKKKGYCGGRGVIGHTANEEGAEALREAILKEYPDADIFLHPMRGLCSYYAERGGVLIGFEIGK